MQEHKGTDAAEYNWNKKEFEAGHIQTEDYEVKFCALDLNKSLEKMDKELRADKDETISKRQDSLSEDLLNEDNRADLLEVI